MTSMQQRGLRVYPKLKQGLLTKQTGLSSFLQHPQRCWGGLLSRIVWLVSTPATSKPWDTHRGLVRSQNSWYRESQELQESCYYQCPGGQATEIYHRGTMGHPQESQTGQVQRGSHGRQWHCHWAPGYWPIPCHEDTTRWDCTASIHQGRPARAYEPQTIREASPAESMSEDVNNKVRLTLIST